MLVVFELFKKLPVEYYSKIIRNRPLTHAITKMNINTRTPKRIYCILMYMNEIPNTNVTFVK